MALVAMKSYCIHGRNYAGGMACSLSRALAATFIGAYGVFFFGTSVMKALK